MIFVTVGTHEQPFNRLLKEMDDLVKKGNIKESVVMQTGYSSFKPKYCKYKSMFSFEEMKDHVSKAHIVITHGGPSSFIEVIQAGKIPIVVPRLKEFDEHINDHQLKFIQLIAKKSKNIIPIYDIKEILNAINNYDNDVQKYENNLTANNCDFNNKFNKLVTDLFK